MTKTPNHQTLVAVDWKNEGLDIGRVLGFVGEALISHEVGEQAHWKTGEPQTFHRVTFNSREVRNTEVNGVGYHSGFVVHVE